MDFETLMKKLEETEGFLDRLTDEHERRLKKALVESERKILRLMERLERTADGRIKGPAWTLKQAQKIHAKLAPTIMDGFGGVYSYLGEAYGEIEAYVLELLKTGFDVPEAFSTIEKQSLRILRDQQFKVYRTLTDDTVDKIAQHIYSAVLTGWSYDDLTEHIAAAITGYRDIRGRSLAMHAGTYAQDSLMEYYQSAENLKAKDSGVDKYVLYFGNVIRDSREFCIARAGKVFTKEEVDGWQDLDWAGKKPGDVWINRGGYRCRHKMLFVKPEWVPDGQISMGDYFDEEGKIKPEVKKRIRRESEAAKAEEKKPKEKRKKEEKPITKLTKNKRLFDHVKPNDAITKTFSTKALEKVMTDLYPNVTWDFAGMDLVLAQQTADVADRMYRLFPEMTARGQYFGSYKNKKAAKAAGSDATIAEALAHADNMNQYIGINLDYFGDYVKLKDVCEHSYLFVHWPKIVGERATIGGGLIQHEFGHWFYNWLKYWSGDGRTVQMPRQFESFFVGFTKDDIRQLSAYALTNSHESFAEAFAAAMNMSPNEIRQKGTHKFIQLILDYIEETLKLRTGESRL